MKITKICPPISELCGIKTNVRCPEEGCEKIFNNSSQLDMHLLKHHKKEGVWKNKKDTTCHYHCPVSDCHYNETTDHFFKTLKYLKQHYLKVHAEKNFQCEKCQKGFSTQAALNHHTRICGVKFVCSCNYSYDSYEALLTHAKRFSHTFDEKFKFYGKMHFDGQFPPSSADPTVTQSAVGSADDGGNCPSKCILRSPKRAASQIQKEPANQIKSFQPISTTIAVPVHFLAALALSELSKGMAVDKGIQTEAHVADNKRSRKAPCPLKCDRTLKRRMSAQTQTGTVPRNKRPKICAETQTSGDYILKKAMKEANIPCENQKKQGNKRRKSMETQTTNSVRQIKQSRDFNVGYSNLDSNFTTIHNFPSASNLNCADSTNTYEIGLPDLWACQKNSSSTQTSPVSLSAFMDQEELLSHSVTQTDLNLSFLESESGLQSGSQAIHNLHRYFEDNSTCSFTAEVNKTFEPELATSSCRSNMETTLGSLVDEPQYSPSQMDTLLGQHHKTVFDENRSCSIETQTELEISDSFLSECADDGDTSFTFCSTIETQTTEDYSSFDQLLYSNMCTQTCEESLYSELGFVNIQTQTAWSQFGSDDSMFVSTETQTALSVASTSNTSKVTSSETSHMETQTNINEFRELIAELSKQASVDKLL